MAKVIEYQSDNIEEAKEIQRIFKRYPLGGIPKRYGWLLWLRRLVFINSIAGVIPSANFFFGTI